MSELKISKSASGLRLGQAFTSAELNKKAQVMFDLNAQLAALMEQVEAISTQLNVPLTDRFKTQTDLRKKILDEHKLAKDRNDKLQAE